MVRLRGATIVGPDRLIDGAALVMADGRIAAIEPDRGAATGDLDCAGGWIVPGFVDTHIHGTGGIDVLASGADAVARVAARLPQHGVTGFLPTSVACPPDDLTRFLAAVGAAQAAAPAGARVLGAHLESNFISPAFRGAQPVGCLRLPPRAGEPATVDGHFSGAAITAVISAHRPAARIVTLAPELPGAIDLVRTLTAGGHRVSLGHSGASYEQGLEAIAAGACHATHLFNRMPPLGHRAPGLAGAVLGADTVTCEIVGDGHHVHPAMAALAIRAAGARRIAAITDAASVAGLPLGATGPLGEHVVRVGPACAELADGTVAGSLATMDGVFRWLVRTLGLGLVEAVHLTSTTPARAAGRPDLGRLEAGGSADLVVLDRDLRIRQTWVGGRLAWNSGPGPDVSPAEVQR